MLQCGLYLPSIFKDVHRYVVSCDACQHSGNVSMRNNIPLSNTLELEICYVWGIGFIGPFPSSCCNKYILVAVNYVSKWAEAIAFPTSNARVVKKFFKKIIFPRFGIPRVVRSEGGSHFIECNIETLLRKYAVIHKVGLGYHP